MFNNKLPNTIKYDVEKTFKGQLKYTNQRLRDHKEIAHEYKLPKGTDPVLIENIIYTLISKGFIKTLEIYRDDRKIVEELYSQLLKTIPDKLFPRDYKNGRIKIEYRIGNKVADIKSDDKFIEIKNVDFTKQGACGTTAYLLDYIYQVVEYIIIERLHYEKPENCVIIWLPLFNLRTIFRFTEKDIFRWIILYLLDKSDIYVKNNLPNKIIKKKMIYIYNQLEQIFKKG